jgi:hypothetical protein
MGIEATWTLLRHHRSRGTDGGSTPLGRVALTGAESEAAYSEDWLQKIVEMTT